jgi:redox-sensitive bicupin YhaK (pirin superfamily)
MSITARVCYRLLQKAIISGEVGFMIEVRRSEQRGRSRQDWLDSRHTFSFADYFDPNYMGFRALRVINEDRIAPAAGFPSHPHRDMEIITYVLDGALAHQDSLGNGSTILPGEVQRMSAGTGIIHSEFNSSTTAPLHLLQIWILPRTRGGKPGYEQQKFTRSGGAGGFVALAAPPEEAAAVRINADARLYMAVFEARQWASFELAVNRFSWVQIARGEMILNGIALGEGDGAAVASETRLDFEAASDAEVLLFDLA